MSTIARETIINIVGNILAWLLLGLITLYLTSRNSQTRFIRFFGLSQRKKVKIYFSNLWDLSTTTANKPWGSILAGREFEASQTLSRLFGSSPFSIPEIVRGFVDAFWIGRKCELILEVSPMDEKHDKNNNLIVIGSALKNRVRRNYIQNGCVHVIIDGEPLTDTNINIHSNTLSDQFLVITGERKGDKPERGSEYELGIIEKISEQNRVIFFCLGKTGYGTRAAAEYLARNWQDLWRTHKNQCFARCLWFQKQSSNTPVVDWEPIYHEDVYFQSKG